MPFPLNFQAKLKEENSILSANPTTDSHATEQTDGTTSSVRNAIILIFLEKSKKTFECPLINYKPVCSNLYFTASKKLLCFRLFERDKIE